MEVAPCESWSMESCSRVAAGAAQAQRIATRAAWTHDWIRLNILIPMWEEQFSFQWAVLVPKDLPDLCRIGVSRWDTGLGQSAPEVNSEEGEMVTLSVENAVAWPLGWPSRGRMGLVATPVGKGGKVGDAAVLGWRDMRE